MAKLKVPSLQHLSRIWQPDSGAIKKVLIGLTKHGPTFSYDPLYGAVRDLLLLKVPYEQVVEGIRRGIKREDVRENFLGVMPLIREHFEGVSANFVQSVAQRFYPVGRGLLVPFQPPLIYGANGEIHFPWFSFWRSNPLAAERLSLFVSIVDDVLLQDPDLDAARFVILDFSAPSSKMPRRLTAIQARDIPRLSSDRKIEMLSTFAQGYELAHAELRGQARYSQDERPDDDDPNQLGLF
ncbi:MAG TPA: hypothetical protein VNZ27_04730 [Rhodanobacter sp.]|jgi:hypothetical protein|nr:hypothetical protein [Rhodanobacter sp.]